MYRAEADKKSIYGKILQNLSHDINLLHDIKLLQKINV